MTDGDPSQSARETERVLEAASQSEKRQASGKPARPRVSRKWWLRTRGGFPPGSLTSPGTAPTSYAEGSPRRTTGPKA